MYFKSFLLLLSLSLFNFVLAKNPESNAENQTPKVDTAKSNYLPVGLFIGKIEEGARIFTPVRLLPFEHPESEGHEFPNALQLHQNEYEALVYLGKLAGLKLSATLQRYPKPPINEWWYDEFQELPIEEIKNASIRRSETTNSPIHGLKAGIYRNGVPLCFIIDTRALSLEERGMSKPTTMGLDITRKQFLEGLKKAGSLLSPDTTWAVIFEH